MPDETPWQALDVLSPQARSIMEANRAAAYTRLVVAGEGGAEVQQLLTRLTPEGVLKGKVGNLDEARATLAALWLWHDCLDESHTISQAIATPTGSFWHAIMHRREGDFSNAKYWYARCRHHPALDEVAALGRATLGPSAATGPLHALMDDRWDPDAFVDIVEAVHRKPDDPLYTMAVGLQRMEWQALFAHCARRAAGETAG